MSLLKLKCLVTKMTDVGRFSLSQHPVFIRGTAASDFCFSCGFLNQDHASDVSVSVSSQAPQGPWWRGKIKNIISTTWSCSSSSYSINNGVDGSRYKIRRLQQTLRHVKTICHTPKYNYVTASPPVLLPFFHLSFVLLSLSFLNPKVSFIGFTYNVKKWMIYYQQS